MEPLSVDDLKWLLGDKDILIRMQEKHIAQLEEQLRERKMDSFQETPLEKVGSVDGYR